MSRTSSRLALLVLSVLSLVPGLARADAAAYAAAHAEALAGNHAKAIDLARAALEKDAEDYATARLLQDLLLANGRDAELEKLLEGLPSAATREYLQLRMTDPKDAADGLRALQGQEGAPSFVGLDLAYAQWRADRRASAESEAKNYIRDASERP